MMRLLRYCKAGLITKRSETKANLTVDDFNNQLYNAVFIIRAIFD